MLLQIDEFFFEVKHNIESIKKSISVNLSENKTITKPVYTHIGGFKESLSFEANILLEDIQELKEFETKVKECKPLKISSFDLVKYKYIFIQNFDIEVGDFIRNKIGNDIYFTKKISIDGVIINNYEDVIT